MSDNFDDHISRSIPSYNELRDLIEELCVFYTGHRRELNEPSTILDIGCSQGTMIRRIWETHKECKFDSCVGVDINKDFEKHWKEELSKDYASLEYSIENILEMGMPSNLTFAYSLFTTQFLVGEKKKLFNLVRKHLITGGGFVVCEKIKVDTPIKKTQSHLHHIWKNKKGGFSQVEINQKEQALKEITEYNTEQELLDMLGKTKDGCKFECEVIWKSHNFIAIQCTRDENMFDYIGQADEQIENENKKDLLREKILGTGWMKD